MALESRPMVRSYMGFGEDVSPFVNLLSDLPELPDGNCVFVRSRCSWYLRTGGAWVRTKNTDPAFAALSDVYVNTATGDDDNPGTLAEPLKTIGEWAARLGGNPNTTIPGQTVHVSGNVSEGDLKLYLPQGTTISIVGDPTVVLTTTIAAVTEWDASGGTVGTIQGAASLAPHVGKIFRVASGPRAGAIGVIKAVESGANVEVPPLAFGLWIPVLGEPLQAGDTIEVLNLPTWAGKLTVAGDYAFAFVAWFDFTATDSHSVFVTVGAQLWFSGCVLQGGLDSGASCFLSVIGCRASGAIRSEYPSAYAEAWNSAVHAFTIRNAATAQLGENTFTGYVTADSLSYLAIYGDTWFDNDVGLAGNVCLEIGVNATVETFAAVAGRNATGVGGRIRIHAGGALYYSSAPIIAGSGTEMFVGGTSRTFAGGAYAHPTNLARYAPSV